MLAVVACGQAAPAPSPGKPVQITVVWTAASGAMSGLWTAFEAGYFKEENLQVELSHIPSSSSVIPALVAGEVQFATVDGRLLVEAVVRGADVRAIAGVTNRLVMSVMASPKIQGPQDLRGKKLGITKVGSTTHTAALQALRIWGMDASKDVSLVPLKEVPNILTALQAGQIDAGVVSPPTNTRARDAGFKELINLAIDGPQYPAVTIGAKGTYASSNPDVVRRFVRAYARGVHRFKTDKPFALKAINVYLKLGDQSVLEDTWQQFSRYLAEPPFLLGADSLVADVASQEPKASGLKPEQFMDTRIVQELDRAGYFKHL